MKNKLLFGICAVAITAALMTSCKKKTDLVEVQTQIAQNSFLKDAQNNPLFYYFIEVDTAKMSTTLHEWKFEADHTGHYEVATTGNGLDSDETFSLTWEDLSLAEDGLNWLVPVTVKGKGSQVLKWADGVIKTSTYTTSSNIASMASTLRTLHVNIEGINYFVNDTPSAYITVKKDTLHYLAWKTENIKKSNKWTMDSINNYKNFLLENMDTLLWFNQNYPNQAVPDTVRFNYAKPNPDGTYNGVIPRPYEATEIKDIETNHGLTVANNGEILLNHVDMATTGAFEFFREERSIEYYDKPETASALRKDDYVKVENGLWTPYDFVNAKKFTILMKGKVTRKVYATKGGKVTEDKNSVEEPGFVLINVSNFNKADGSAMINDVKFKKK